MLGTSTAELIFIRACIIGLSSVIPITSAYTLLALTVLPSSLRLPLPAELWFAAELIFYFGFYLPRKTRLQKVPPTKLPLSTTPLTYPLRSPRNTRAAPPPPSAASSSSAPQHSSKTPKHTSQNGFTTHRYPKSAVTT